MKILLIEDDANIIHALTPALKEAGYITTAIANGEAGFFAAQIGEYDLIVLDYNLPGLNGREIIRKLRANGSTIPIIMLTVHSELTEKIDILNIGADDYLTKPFSFSELLARIKAILRRPENWEEDTLKIGGLEVNPNKFLVTQNNQRVSLSSKEFALLEYLLRHKGLILSRQNIMEHVWDENADPFSNTIEVHIRNLRRKLETDGRRLIFTVSNRGYKIDDKR
jgi:DNA-binding response OmpR family regulator